MPGQARKAAEADTVTVEFVGTPPYGVELLDSHTIKKGKNVLFTHDGHTADVPRDLVWRKTSGWKVAIPAEETELLEALRTQPYLKVPE